MTVNFDRLLPRALIVLAVTALAAGGAAWGLGEHRTG